MEKDREYYEGLDKRTKEYNSIAKYVIIARKLKQMMKTKINPLPSTIAMVIC